MSRPEPLIEFQLTEGNPFTLEVYNTNTNEHFNDLEPNLTLGSTRVYTFPSPSAITLLTIAGTIPRRRSQQHILAIRGTSWLFHTSINGI
jgi:hypothetical protein